jgi:hypothetical protein
MKQKTPRFQLKHTAVRHPQTLVNAYKTYKPIPTYHPASPKQVACTSVDPPQLKQAAITSAQTD